MAIKQIPQTIVPASVSGMTSLASGSIAASATGIDISSISASYNELVLYIKNVSVDIGAKLFLRFNNDSATNYAYQYYSIQTGVLGQIDAQSQTYLSTSNAVATVVENSNYIRIPNYSNSNSWKVFSWLGSIASADAVTGHSIWKSTSSINRIAISTNSGLFDSGTYELFGVK